MIVDLLVQISDEDAKFLIKDKIKVAFGLLKKYEESKVNWRDLIHVETIFENKGRCYYHCVELYQDANGNYYMRWYENDSSD